ncbi:MAG: DegV family protein [Firmicutes bacterium]|nr:DegV family protein [Bacillota bacterium]
MHQTAIMTDSNSGITQEEGRQAGIYVLPMPVIMQDQVYYEDIDLTQVQFYEGLLQGAEVSTSQPSPVALLEQWRKILRDYEELVYIPMSSGLSGSCETALGLAQDYNGRVQVVDNQRISVTTRRSVYEALALAREGLDAASIRSLLEAHKKECGIYIMVDTLTYLKKGGRITPAAAALGNLLKLKPVLQIHGGKLDAYGKARTLAQAERMMIQALQHDMEQCLGPDPDPSSYWIDMAYTYDREQAEAFRTHVTEAFPAFRDEIYMGALPLSIACHIGPGALAVTFTKKIHGST